MLGTRSLLARVADLSANRMFHVEHTRGSRLPSVAERCDLAREP